MKNSAPSRLDFIELHKHEDLDYFPNLKRILDGFSRMLREVEMIKISVSTVLFGNVVLDTNKTFDKI